MKKFVELIKRVHQERYSVVINKILAEKIPVAFLSIAPLENLRDKLIPREFFLLEPCLRPCEKVPGARAE